MYFFRVAQREEGRGWFWRDGGQKIGHWTLLLPGSAFHNTARRAPLEPPSLGRALRIPVPLKWIEIVAQLSLENRR